MPLALSLIDLDGFGAIDPLMLVTVLNAAGGLTLALAVIAIVSMIDRRSGA